MSGLPGNSFGVNYPAGDPEALVAVLGIGPQDRVLDVGGAANPFPRANVVCDLTFGCSAERNGAPSVFREDVTYVECAAEGLPFADGEFDFVYATQVLEHVRDPAAACAELSRVARRGFIEVPSRMGELTNGNPSHRWLVDREGDELVFEPRGYLEHPLRNFFYGVILQDEGLRRLADTAYRNVFNHQVLFEGQLRCRVVSGPEELFDYDDPVQAGRAHYSFAHNIVRTGADPAYTLPDAWQALRLLPDSVAARLLVAVHLMKLLRVDEAREVLAGTSGTLAEALGSLAGRLEQGEPVDLRSLPLPPEDPLPEGPIPTVTPEVRPRVSVVVAGDDPALLRRSAESALTQDYPHVDVLVAASCDPGDLQQAFQGLEMGGRLGLSPQPEGATLGTCLNQGYIATTGPVVAFLLQGDRFLPHHLDVMVARLQEEGTEVAHSDRALLDGGGIVGPDLIPDDPASAGVALSCLVSHRDPIDRVGARSQGEPDQTPLQFLIRLARRERVVHVREATVLSPGPLPAGAEILEGVCAGSHLRPVELLRGLMTSHVREAGLRARIAELEARLRPRAPAGRVPAVRRGGSAPVSFLDRILKEAFKDRDPGAFPFSLGVEVTNLCNLRCPMCPREIANRGYGKMEFELWTSLVDQCVGQDHGVFLPTGFGESFLHPRFREMLDYTRSQGMQRPIMLITNGTLLSEEHCQGLVIGEVDLVSISLDGADRETFEKLRKNADYAQVVENVKTLVRVRGELGSSIPRIILRMILMEDTKAGFEAFKEFWTPHLEAGDEVAYSAYQTWGGAVEDRRIAADETREEQAPTGRRRPCRMIYKTMQVYYDGRTTPCCYDYDCVMEIGNARETPLGELWTGEQARHFRRLHEEGRLSEIAICRDCQEYVP